MEQRILTIGILLALLLFAYACSEEQRDDVREAEKAYASLLYALHTEDQVAADAAAVLLDHRLSEVRQQHFYPLREAEMDKLLYLFGHAEADFIRARENIDVGDFTAARLDVDQATQAILAANPLSISELYLANTYDFLASWLEVNEILQDPDLCGLDATALRRSFRELRNSWQNVRHLDLSPVMYPETDIDPQAFTEVRDGLADGLAKFLPLLKNEEAVGGLNVAAEQIDERVWALVLLFAEESVGAI